MEEEGWAAPGGDGFWAAEDGLALGGHVLGQTPASRAQGAPGAFLVVSDIATLPTLCHPLCTGGTACQAHTWNTLL